MLFHTCTLKSPGQTPAKLRNQPIVLAAHTYTRKHVDTLLPRDSSGLRADNTVKERVSESHDPTRRTVQNISKRLQRTPHCKSQCASPHTGTLFLSQTLQTQPSPRHCTKKSLRARLQVYRSLPLGSGNDNMRPAFLFGRPNPAA